MEGWTGMLPGGYWDPSGVLHREFELSVLTGRDEELLAKSGNGETASSVSAVLSRSVRRLGSITPVSEQVARQLLVADRQYLLLKLRQLTFGDVVRADLVCPWADCGKQMQFEFGVDQVPVEEAAERAPDYSLVLSREASENDEEDQRGVRFRLPNGGDQEDLGPLLAENEAVALTLLLSRAIRSIGDVCPPGPEHVSQLSPRARAEIEAEMERIAPRVETNIDTVCAECGRSFTVPFDVHRFFFGDFRTDSNLLYRQVHYLAYNYHWSESEIMDMPRTKRQKYIELLSDEMERLNDEQ